MRDLRAIVEAATPAEWTARTHYSSWGTWWSVDPVTDMWKDDHEEANAEFIATFDPVMVGRLLDIVQAAREAWGRVRDPYYSTVNHQADDCEAWEREAGSVCEECRRQEREALERATELLGGALAALDTEDNQ